MYKWTPLSEIESLAAFARELPCVIVNRVKKVGRGVLKKGTEVVEQAGAVVEKATRIPSEIIDTAKKTAEDARKRLGGALQ